MERYSISVVENSRTFRPLFFQAVFSAQCAVAGADIAPKRDV